MEGLVLRLFHERLAIVFLPSARKMRAQHLLPTPSEQKPSQSIGRELKPLKSDPAAMNWLLASESPWDRETERQLW